MPDNRSEIYRKMRDERRELVQLAVEELIRRDGCIPSSAEVSDELGMGRDNNAIRMDWDLLHEQGKLPERPGKRLPRLVTGKSFGEEGGGLFLESESMLRRIAAEIVNASPKYRELAQVFWVAHLNTIITLAEEAMTAAVGSTVDELIDRINEKGKS